MKVANISNGPRGFWQGGSLVMLEAGKAAEADLTKDELAKAARDGWFEIGGEDEAPGLEAMTVPELRDLAEAEEIDLGDATKKADIIAAIELARDEN